MKIVSLKNIAIFSVVAVLVYVYFSGNRSSVQSPEIAALMAKLPEKIDYNEHVKPILSDRCFKCHGPDKNKIEAGLQLANFEEATKKNKEGRRAIVPHNAGESELVKRILSHDPEEMMPTPKSNLSLTDEEKAILIKWIEQGATYKEHWALADIKQPSIPRVGKSFWARWGFSEDAETQWVKNPIDNFTLSKMKTLGLQPKPEADKATLLRRVSMDLTGLPPTPQELNAFLTDNTPDAYEKVVARLLNSPHFGEQQAVSWLDLARYADSNGYQDDALKTSYPYRDWVIKSFNDNLPFDKFVLYQLAGDLLPNPTTDMLLATAFNRNHAMSEEDGIIPEEYQVEYVADRANTFGKAFLGLTTECARCHDHKYDPISQKDYYSLYAFFNNVNEHGQVPHKAAPSPTITLTSDEVAQQIRFIHEKIAEVETTRKNEQKNLVQRFQNWLQKGSQAAIIPTNQALLIDVPFDSTFDIKNVPPPVVKTDKNKQQAKPEIKKTDKKAANKTALALEKDKNKDKNKEVAKPKRRPGYKNFANDTLPIETAGDLDFLPQTIRSPRGVGIKLVGESYLKVHETAKWWEIPNFNPYYYGVFESNQPFSVGLWVNILDPKFEGRVFNRQSGALSGCRGYECVRLKEGNLAFRINSVWPDNALEFETDFKMIPDTWTHLTMTYNGSSKAEGLKVYINGQVAKGTIITDNLNGSTIYEKDKKFQGTYAASPVFSVGRMHTTFSKNYAVDELKIFGRVLTPLEIQSEIDGQNRLAEALAATGKQTAQQKEALFEYFKTHIDDASKQNQTQIQDLVGQNIAFLNKGIDVSVMNERKRVRKSYILNRGVYDDPKEEVIAETPLKIGKLPRSYPRNRLGLAQWLLDTDNPLFARVMSNRLWLQYFGRGLVKTQEDFGSQGEMPSHPDLLDWLAVQYRKDNWDTKAFIQRIVLSNTYRQSSKATKEEMEADPDNKWLARGSSYRFSAEQVRDNALAASGLLVRKIGGESVYPYQPAGIWEALATRNVVSYRQQHGDSLYRRSMYTILKRTSPPPMMINFDAPDRSLCVVRRQKTATPLQALVTLNDPQFVEAARVLAERTLKLKPALDERIGYFFEAAVSRLPRPQELALMKELYQIEYAGFLKNRQRAENLIATGEYPVDKTIDTAELAAYTVVANTVLNYDETIIKR
jgi:Protein of unknown function (DUF1553)/Protein of unknown function (DUF1549)/Planctomycete cytochrome C/Concanavalin A-like lectin/glucanases superfamily